MARGGIGIPATPKTELSMKISKCFLLINITKRSISDAGETLNSPLVIAMQNSPTIILLDSGQHLENVFPGHWYALLIEVVKFPVFYFLRYYLICNMKIFYPFCVEIYFLTTILCSKGIDSG